MLSHALPIWLEQSRVMWPRLSQNIKSKRKKRKMKLGDVKIHLASWRWWCEYIKEKFLGMSCLPYMIATVSGQCPHYKAWGRDDITVNHINQPKQAVNNPFSFQFTKLSGFHGLFLWCLKTCKSSIRLCSTRSPFHATEPEYLTNLLNNSFSVDSL